MKIKAMLLLLFIPMCMFAQHGKFSSSPGNARFDQLKNLKAFGKVSEIYLDQNLFNMIDYEETEDGEELKRLLQPIKMIVLYTIDDIKKSNADSLRAEFEAIDSGLMARDWSKLMSFDEGRVFANTYLKYTDKNRVAGLAITFLESSGNKYKANIINIIGDIDMKNIGKIGRKFRLPALGSSEEDE